MKIILAILLLCSTADAGRCHWRCRARYQRACNRSHVIAQGIPRMRAEAGLNRSRALLNFSKPFNIWGWLFP